METLNCSSCGEDWERPLTRGRKPTMCPSCKDGDAKVEVKPPEVLDPVTMERKFARPNSQGDITPLGEPDKILRGANYYEIELGDKVIKKGDKVRISNERGVFKFDSLGVVETQAYYVWVIKDGRYRAFDATRLKLPRKRDV